MEFNKISDDSYTLFDYMMNVHQSYNELSRSAQLLVKRARRNRKTFDQEVYFVMSDYKIPRWWTTARGAMDMALNDHVKAFKDDVPVPHWLRVENLHGVMKLVVKSLDRFDLR